MNSLLCSCIVLHYMIVHLLNAFYDTFVNHLSCLSSDILKKNHCTASVLTELAVSQPGFYMWRFPCAAVFQCDSCILWLHHPTHSILNHTHTLTLEHTQHLTHFIPNTRPAQVTSHHTLHRKKKKQQYRVTEVLHCLFTFSLSLSFSWRYFLHI